MRRIADRIAVFTVAVLLDAAVQFVVGPPPAPHPTWLAYGLERLAARAPAPRLRPVMPVLLAVLATRCASLISHADTRGGSGRGVRILAQGAVLAATFNAWRSLRAAQRAERELAEADESVVVTGAVEIELGHLAQGASEGVVGAWAAYAVADLPGAVAWAAAESIGGAAGPEGPLATVLESSGQLAAVQQARDAIAGAATLAAARGNASLSLQMDDIVDSAGTPLAVTAMTVALDRRVVWNGRISGWQRPPPDRGDLRRANRLALRTLAVLAAATAAAIVVAELLKPPRRGEDWRREPPNWERLFDIRER